MEQALEKSFVDALEAAIKEAGIKKVENVKLAFLKLGVKSWKKLGHLSQPEIIKALEPSGIDLCTLIEIREALYIRDNLITLGMTDLPKRAPRDCFDSSRVSTAPDTPDTGADIECDPEVDASESESESVVDASDAANADRLDASCLSLASVDSVFRPQKSFVGQGPMYLSDGTHKARAVKNAMREKLGSLSFSTLPGRLRFRGAAKNCVVSDDIQACTGFHVNNVYQYMHVSVDPPVVTCCLARILEIRKLVGKTYQRRQSVQKTDADVDASVSVCVGLERDLHGVWRDSFTCNRYMLLPLCDFGCEVSIDNCGRLREFRLQCGNAAMKMQSFCVSEAFSSSRLTAATTNVKRKVDQKGLAAMSDKCVSACFNVVS